MTRAEWLASLQTFDKVRVVLHDKRGRFSVAGMVVRLGGSGLRLVGYTAVLDTGEAPGIRIEPLK